MNGPNISNAKRPVAWVTGASSGIGRALSLALAADGWSVAASARGTEGLNALSDLAPDRIEAFSVDITDRDAVKTAYRTIGEVLGPVDLAVFCAGTYQRDEPARFDSAVLSRMVELNIMGTAHCLDAVVPDMVGRGKGQIAVVSSVSGYTGLPGAAFYGATKAALINMCEAMRPELQTRGVDLKIVSPGFVETPLTALNDFPMPFMVSAETAAGHIVRGLKTSRFEIAFPWQMRLSLRLLGMLPYRLQFALKKRMLRKD